MKPLTEEWVGKAEGDYLTASREYKADPPNYDAVAYHAQQSAEKYIKAILAESGLHFPKTHDLGALLDILDSGRSELEPMREQLNALTDIGLESRYPGDFADKDDAGAALITARAAREISRKTLGLAI